MADKSTRWAFTAYENEWPLFHTMPDIVAEWEWQPEECPETKRKHYQGYIRTKRQVRFAQLKGVLPGVHLEVAKNWEALIQYCRKDKSKAGASVHQVNASKAMTMADALTRLASYTLPYSFDGSYNTESEYWRAVNDILSIDPNTVGLYTQPQYLRAWNHTVGIWKTNSAESVAAEIDIEQTDRQTDECLILDDCPAPGRVARPPDEEDGNPPQETVRCAVQSVKRLPKKVFRPSIDAPSS